MHKINKVNYDLWLKLMANRLSTVYIVFERKQKVKINMLFTGHNSNHGVNYT